MAILGGILAGLVAGLVGAGAMSLVHKGLTAINPGPPPPPAAAEQKEEDSTVKVADGITRLILQRPLPDDKKPLAANLVHYGFGASVGAVYGGVAAVMPRVTMALGLPFGVAVWLGAHVIMVPALGLAPPPTRQPLGKEASELALHLVYGAVTELGRRLLRRGL
jgi:putative membrane protein